jgi:hypothetical protein
MGTGTVIGPMTVAAAVVAAGVLACAGPAVVNAAEAAMDSASAARTTRFFNM